MTDDEFKRHLYRQLEEDKKNAGVLTHRLYNKPNRNNNSQPRPKQKKSS